MARQALADAVLTHFGQRILRLGDFPMKTSEGMLTPCIQSLGEMSEPTGPPGILAGFWTSARGELWCAFKITNMSEYMEIHHESTDLWCWFGPWEQLQVLRLDEGCAYASGPSRCECGGEIPAMQHQPLPPNLGIQGSHNIANRNTKGCMKTWGTIIPPIQLRSHELLAAVSWSCLSTTWLEHQLTCFIKPDSYLDSQVFSMLSTQHLKKSQCIQQRLMCDWWGFEWCYVTHATLYSMQTCWLVVPEREPNQGK